KDNSGIFCTIQNTEVRAVWMNECERADAGFRIHHESFRKLNAYLFRPQKLPDGSLVLKFRTGGGPKAVPFPAIPRREPLRHGHLRWIGESPVLPNASM